MALVPLLPGLQENKSELSRRTWWGLFFVSTGMTVFSGVLLGLMVFKIQAFCFFCVLSAALSLILLVLSAVGGGWDDPGTLIFRGVLLALAVLLGGLIWASVVDPDRPESTATGGRHRPSGHRGKLPCNGRIGEPSHRWWCRDVFGLLVPPLP
jgi:hypothetical protein